MNVPVYLNDAEGEMIGYANEGMGHYADALTFHIPEDLCKKLSTGHFEFSFSYDFSDPDAEITSGRRVKLNYICLTGRTPLEPMGPRTRRSAGKENAE
jgi:hypothetical protein